MLLLELEPPFDKRGGPARAPAPGQAVAPRHRPARAPARARAPPEGDQRGRRPARAARRGVARRARVRATPSRSAPRPRASAAPRRAAAPTRTSSAPAPPPPTGRSTTRSASRVPDHSVVHRYARCLSYPEWGVGSVNGIYFTGDGDDVQQWARVSFQVGVRTVPAGSLQFVDFSTPGRRAPTACERFMTAAKHALAEGDFALAAQRLVYARDAEPRNPAVLRLMTLAFWQAGDFSAAGARRARLDPRRARAAPRRTATPRASTRTWARTSQAADEAAREADARARRRIGVGAARPAAPAHRSTGGRTRRRSSGRVLIEPSERGPARPRARRNLMGDVGAEVSACEQATALAPEDPAAWAQLRPRAGAHRPRDRHAWPRASARSRSGPIPRSRTCSSGCATPSRASSPRRRLEPDGRRRPRRGAGGRRRRRRLRAARRAQPRRVGGAARPRRSGSSASATSRPPPTPPTATRARRAPSAWRSSRPGPGAANTLGAVGEAWASRLAHRRDRHRHPDRPAPRRACTAACCTRAPTRRRCSGR